MSCEYVRKYYGVPAEIGRRVVIDGKPGIIAKDMGNYIGVLFDADKPSCIYPCHPTSNVEYQGTGKVRQMTRSQARYRRWLEYRDSFDSFLDFLKWDGLKERSWNGGVQ